MPFFAQNDEPRERHKAVGLKVPRMISIMKTHSVYSKKILKSLTANRRFWLKLSHPMTHEPINLSFANVLVRETPRN